MRIIITGGTGMIGSRLAKNLAADGHDIIILSRNPNKHSLPTGIRAEKWDARTAAGWGYLADGADAIVNLAGENISGSGFIPQRWTPDRKKRIQESRLFAGQAVTAAVAAAVHKP
ncbi:MAG: NAD-dependent epimerase/dehydratase family protein, partial [Anaerolineales bacterium]|nr:NAD-dependent epimerase/dehydratase family protein [Anaerolineales bacterium]